MLELSNQFKLVNTSLNDVFIIKKLIIDDDRGSFVKIFSSNVFPKEIISTNFKEAYYSYSKKSVIRGLHYQIPPHSHAKLITVLEGEILDVCIGVDKKNKSNNFGKHFSTILSSKNALSLYIPEGYAHGYQVLSDYAIVINHLTSVYEPTHESGILYNSFGFDWPIKNPIISEKDQLQMPFSQLNN